MTLPEWWPVDTVYQIRDNLEGMKEIPDDSIDFILTDPPFNVGIDYGDTTDDEMSDSQYEDWFLERLVEMKRIIKPGHVIIVFSGDIKIHSFLNAAERCDMIFHHFIKWHKPHSQRALSGFVLFYRTELGLLLSKDKPDQKILNRKKLFSDTLTYDNTSSTQKDKVGERVDHPCQRPVLLYRHLIEGLTKENDIVLDPFLGSGTTALAGMLCNRVGLGFEISQEYEAVIQKRIMSNTPRLDFYFGGRDNGE